jgi:hypothetical protein
MKATFIVLDGLSIEKVFSDGICLTEQHPL